MIPLSDITETVKGMDWELNFGQLVQDVDFVSNCNSLVNHLKALERALDQVIPMRENYEHLSRNQKVEVDLFLLYTLNSLTYLNLRLKGTDMTNHPIKREFARIKTVMVRWKEVKERKLRPTVNIEAAQRFVRGGLYDHKNKDNSDMPPNKKIRFEDDD